jgi:hypothetical protein
LEIRGNIEHVVIYVRFKIFKAVTILMFFWVLLSPPSGLKAAVSVFSLEDGDSTLLRNIGYYQPIHMAI